VELVEDTEELLGEVSNELVARSHLGRRESLVVPMTLLGPVGGFGPGQLAHPDSARDALSIGTIT
jgi:hypothetical protein